MLNKYQTKEAICQSDRIMKNLFIIYSMMKKDIPAGYMSIQFRDKELFLSKFYVVAAKRTKVTESKQYDFLKILQENSMSPHDFTYGKQE